MSITSFPFTSINGDRKVTASNFRQYWAAFASNGIMRRYLNECACSKNGMNIIIGTGAVNIQGALAIIDASERVAVVSISTARYATVVLEFNDNSAYRRITPQVVYGTSTAAALLTQNDTVYQFPLCTFLVPAGATTLASVNLIDNREYAIVRTGETEGIGGEKIVKSISCLRTTASGNLWGDLNGDGIVNNQDLILLSRYMQDSSIQILFDTADLDGDGVISSDDYALLQWLHGRISNSNRQVIAKTVIYYEDGTNEFYYGLVDKIPENTGGGGSGGSGEAGVGIYGITFKETDSNGNNVYTITLTDGRTYDIVAPKGDPGSGGDGSGTPGEDGGYYTPSVDANGNLTWTASKSGMASVPSANIKGAKGDKGDTGNAGADGAAGNVWIMGTAITGTNTSGGVFSGSGIGNANIGDIYLNTQTYSIYRCVTTGAPSVAEWAYRGNLKGAPGEAGENGTDGHDGTDGVNGNQWFVSTAITGTNTNNVTFPSSGISSANEGDIALNPDTYSIYRCGIAGDASRAGWAYLGNIRGLPGADGSKWGLGTTINHTGNLSVEYPSITAANAGDFYLNNQTYNIYYCVGDYQWVLVGNIKGTGKTKTKIQCVTHTPSGHWFGDVNGDGEITNADLIMLQRYVDGEVTALDDMAAADINFDGDVDQDDADLLFSELSRGLGIRYVFAKYIITYEDGTTETVTGTVELNDNDAHINQLIASYVDNLDGNGVSY